MRITDLFRHGFGAIQRLQQKARQSLDKPQFRAWYDLAETNQSDEPGDRLERAFVTALPGCHSLCTYLQIIPGNTVVFLFQRRAKKSLAICSNGCILQCTRA